jgi:hypothetical protein
MGTLLKIATTLSPNSTKRVQKGSNFAWSNKGPEIKNWTTSDVINSISYRGSKSKRVQILKVGLFFIQCFQANTRNSGGPKIPIYIWGQSCTPLCPNHIVPSFVDMKILTRNNFAEKFGKRIHARKPKKS